MRTEKTMVRIRKMLIPDVVPVPSSVVVTFPVWPDPFPSVPFPDPSVPLPEPALGSTVAAAVVGLVVTSVQKTVAQTLP